MIDENIKMYTEPPFGYNSLENPNYGFLLEKVPLGILNEIDKGINNIKNNLSSITKYNDQLAGEIEHEYTFPITPPLSQYVYDICNRFEQSSQYINNFFPKIFFKLDIEDIWINFQRKNEYNPMHIHSGLFSFVIWHKVPYLMKNEKNYGYKSDPDRNNNGMFNFIHYVPPQYHNLSDIGCCPLPVDQTWEGIIAVFPSTLNHMVYPFYTSDDYRITISGNILGTV